MQMINLPPGHTYRCGCCNQPQKGSSIPVPWHRVKDSPQGCAVGFCRRCVKERRPNETGRACAVRVLMALKTAGRVLQRDLLWRK